MEKIMTKEQSIANLKETIAATKAALEDEAFTGPVRDEAKMLMKAAQQKLALLETSQDLRKLMRAEALRNALTYN
jgi:hypothetical protein